METEPRLVRVAEVARLLHASPKTIARWSKEGKIPVAFHSVGGHRLYSLAEIEALVESLRGNRSES